MSIKKIAFGAAATALGMMLYDFMPSSQVTPFTGGVKYALDVFTEKSELSFINKTTFTNYIKEISDKPTILLP